jgi:tetratricopeptide (TPR) repeat protein
MGAYSLQKGDLEAGFNSVLTAFQSSVLSKEAKLPILRSYMTKAFRTKNTEDIMQASKLAEALATANPEAIEGFASLGSLAVLENHDEEAKIAFEKALAIDNTPYSLWQDYFMVLSRLHDYPAIVQHGEELLSLFPTHALLLFTVGHANYETKNYQTALQYLKRAADYAYDNALLGDIYLMIGDTYQALQDNSEAEKYYKMA